MKTKGSEKGDYCDILNTYKMSIWLPIVAGTVRAVFTFILFFFFDLLDTDTVLLCAALLCAH